MSWGSVLPSLLCSDGGSAWGRWALQLQGPQLFSSFLAALSSEHFPSETHVLLSAPLRLSYAGLPALLREAVWPHRHRLERRAWRGFWSKIDSLLGNLFSLQWAGDFGGREGGCSSKAKPRGLTLT